MINLINICCKPTDNRALEKDREPLETRPPRCNHGFIVCRTIYSIRLISLTFLNFSACSLTFIHFFPTLSNI